MNRMFFIAIIVIFFFFNNKCYSEIYQYRDSSGVMRFSDTPPPESKNNNGKEATKVEVIGGTKPEDILVKITDSEGRSTSGFFVQANYVIALDAIFKDLKNELIEYDEGKTRIDSDIEQNEETSRKILDQLDQEIKNIEASIDQMESFCRDNKCEDSSFEEIEILKDRKEYTEKKYNDQKKYFYEEKERLESKRNIATKSNYKLRVTTNNGSTYDASIIDKQYNQVLIKVNGIGSPPSVSFANLESRGDTVYVIKAGSSRKSGNKAVKCSTEAGWVDTYGGKSHDKIRFKINIDQMDTTGNPVVDSEGRVIGMVTAVPSPEFIITTRISFVLSSFQNKLKIPMEKVQYY